MFTLKLVSWCDTREKKKEKGNMKNKLNKMKAKCLHQGKVLIHLINELLVLYYNTINTFSKARQLYIYLPNP